MFEGSGITTQLETDEHGNLILPFPSDIFNVLDWKEGDYLKIELFAGRVIFQRVEAE